MAKDVGSIRPWDPGYAERMRLALAAGLRKAGASNYRANDVSGRIFGLLDFVPGVGDVKGAVDTVDAYNAGDMTGAGIGAAATLLGVVPVVGDAAGKAVKKAAGKKSAKVPASEPLLTDEERAQLALDYPTPGPFEWRTDKKTGKVYEGKLKTDLENRLLAERDAIRKSMAKDGYEPIFPVEERYYVDPSNYAPPGDTQVEAVAKTAENAARKREQFDTPEARSALMDAYNKAKDDPLAGRWYAMGQLEKAYIDELGEKSGREAFRRDFAEGMAATTGGADPTANLLTTHYANFTREKGRPLSNRSYELPSPIGGRYIGMNIDQYQKAINEGKGLSAAEQPKRNNFAGNFLGFLNRATIDEQMTSGMTGGLLNAPPGSGGYGAMEAVVIDEADKLGIPAAELQDVAWAGFKGVKGKPMISHVNDAIERTSRITKLPPQEVLKRVIRRQMPLYQMGGTAAGLGLLVPSEEEENYL